jgi:hypothetical protein
VYPRSQRLTPAIFVTALAAFAFTGCGGEASGEVEQIPLRTVSGPGFTFSAPEGRAIDRTPRSVSVLPGEEDSQELESVTIFPLVKPFRPALWPQAARELDDVADRLADSLGGELQQEPKTVRRGGLRGRMYEIAYEHEGTELRQRLTLLLSRRTEYQLLCRWQAAVDAPGACATLESTFKLSA